MIQFEFSPIIPYGAWALALVELILGLYILVLNAWHTANRHTSLLLLLVSINSFAIGWMSGATGSVNAQIPALILATTTTAVEPMLLMSAIALFQPAWLSGKKKWIWTPIYGLILLPLALTLTDYFFLTGMWYTGIESTAYAGGGLRLAEFTQGWLSSYLKLISFQVLNVATASLLLAFAIFNRKAARHDQKLAWLLFFITSLAAYIQVYQAKSLDPAATSLLTNAVFAIAYGFACYTQMVSERRVQRGSLKVRLTALILTVSVPLIIFTNLFVINRAEITLRRYAAQQLHDNSQFLSAQVEAWHDRQARALHTLISQLGQAPMNANQRFRLVDILSATYPDLHLISILDLEGNSIYRSDGAPALNYSQRAWFQRAKSGAPLITETYLDGVSYEPLLLFSAPIRDNAGEIVGVGMITASLRSLDDLLQVHSLGKQARVLVADEQGRIIALSNVSQNQRLSPVNAELINPLNAPSALTPETHQALGARGIKIARLYAARVPWHLSGTTLSNGWTLLIQVPERALLANINLFRGAAWLAALIGTLILLTLSWLTIRQTIQPIATLTRTATSIASGDLSQVAIVDTEDEIGILARAFNSMTSQLRELVATLERRVAERTRDLERRALQLQVAAEVSRETATIHDLEQLLDHTVRLISARFNYYHAGIFLIDKTGKNAVLRAASSEGGQRMLARHHTLEVGKVGIVGYVAGTGKPRLAHNVGEDAVFFNNPDLPQTRSELALPLKARGQVIGVLDVQSTKPSAFTEEDMTTLQILADQVALAIDNTRLLSEMELTLQELRNLYELQVGQAWQKRLGDRKIAFQYDRFGAQQINPDHSIQKADSENFNTLRLPLVFRGLSLGSVTLTKDKSAPPWSPEEMALLHNMLAQLSLALENARLLEETQRRAERERQIKDFSARIRASTDPEVILRTAAAELLQIMGVEQAQILINPNQSDKPTSIQAGNGRHADDGGEDQEQTPIELGTRAQGEEAT